MAAFLTLLTSDLKKPLEVAALPGVFFTDDAKGNVIAVDVLDGGEPATLSGSVKGYVILPDHSTLPPVSGTLSGNRASITLPADAYVLEGPLDIVIKVESGSGENAVRTAVGACHAYVCRTSTETTYDPSGVVPSISDLETWIEACQQATEDANAASGKLENMDATATSLAADASPTASINTVSGHYRLALGIPVGVPPDFSIGTVQGGQTAAVTMTGTASAPVLNFVLPKGDKGDTGNTGATGATGATPQFSIGTVAKGDNAAATITGTAAQPVLNLTLPKGDAGAAGTPGATGSTPAFTVGTITTGAPGTNASVTITGTNENPVLNMTIPRGNQGAPGPVGSVNGIEPDSEGDITLTLASLGGVAKAGDTMTGQLHMDDNITIQKANGYPTLRIMAYTAGSSSNYPSVMIQPNVRSNNSAMFSFFQTVNGSSWERFDLPNTTSATQGGSSTILTTRDFNAPEDFTGAIEFSVAGYAKKATRQGRVCTIEYMSDSVAASSWTQNLLLFTLPVGYRPMVTTYFMGAIAAAPIPALLQLGQDGTVRFYSANGTLSGNPRLYLNFSYSCV